MVKANCWRVLPALLLAMGVRGDVDPPMADAGLKMERIRLDGVAMCDQLRDQAVELERLVAASAERGNTNDALQLERAHSAMRESRAWCLASVAALDDAGPTLSVKFAEHMDASLQLAVERTSRVLRIAEAREERRLAEREREALKTQMRASLRAVRGRD